MDETRALTADAAEAAIADRVEEFGLGAYPRVSVTQNADGSWRVRWDHVERSLAPMPLEAWLAWVERNVGPLGAGDLETTES